MVEIDPEKRISWKTLFERYCIQQDETEVHVVEENVVKHVNCRTNVKSIVQEKWIEKEEIY